MNKLLRPCSESEELKIMRSLNMRMVLHDEEIQYFFNLKKGYEGEQKLEKLLLENLSGDYLILNDLLLEENNTSFQIDSILISQQKIHLFEVKNYEGDFYIKKDIWYTASGKEIKNPLDQLKRSTSLLRQLLQELHMNFEVNGYLIFVNPEFTLYQTPLHLPIIFPSQLNRFLNKLNRLPSQLNGNHSKLAGQLLAAHLNHFSKIHLPDYNYEKLKKGIICRSCSNSFLVPFSQTKLLCSKCGCLENVESAVLRNVKELHLLFPERKITTTGILEWCQVFTSRKTIRRVLTKNFDLVHQGKCSYFVIPEEL